MTNVFESRKLALSCVIISVVTSVTVPASSQAAPDGAKMFQSKCAMCHAGGGNPIKPDKPVKGSKKLKTKDIFKQFLSTQNGTMPAFKPIADNDPALTALYEYCKKLK